MIDVILVDDNPLLVSVLSEILSDSEYAVRTAPDGFAVLMSIRERVPDILISDLHMPRMSGFELLSVVRRRFPSIAVVAMSGSYLGVEIPQGVAADAFYAKGSSSVARIFEILSALDDQATRISLRVATPIWIPCTPIERSGITTTVVTCPECLRTFSHCQEGIEPLREERICPHCHHTVQWAIVRPLEALDPSGLGIAARSRQIALP